MASLKDTSSEKRAVKFEGPSSKTALKTALKTATSTISSSSADSPKADLSAPKPTESCKYGNQCHGCKVCKKGGKGGGAQVAQLSSQVNDLRKELASMKAASAASDARLGKVEADVGETKTGIAEMLAMMQEDRKQRRLPAAPSSRRAIMPAIEVLTTSDSDEPDEFEQVSYGPDDAFTSTVVTKWGQRKTMSTPVACKGGSAATSSSSSSDRKDLSRAAGGGALVVSSKSRQQPLPLPETLGRSRKEGASPPRIERLHGTGLVLCTDLNHHVRLMEDHGYTEVPVIVRKTKGEVSVHFKTAIVNAHDLGDDEAQMLGIVGQASRCALIEKLCPPILPDRWVCNCPSRLQRRKRWRS